MNGISGANRDLIEVLRYKVPLLDRSFGKSAHALMVKLEPSGKSLISNERGNSIHSSTIALLGGMKDI